MVGNSMLLGLRLLFAALFSDIWGPISVYIRGQHTPFQGGMNQASLEFRGYPLSLLSSKARVMIERERK